MRLRLYLPIFFACAAIALVLSYFVTWSVKVASCALPERPGAFISACANPAYGDYEHGAFYLGLESGAIDSLRKAKVIFLGSSRTQFAFSTRSTRSFFRDMNIPYYLLGFGYFEQVTFGQELLRRYNLKPDIIVVNLDTYFSSDGSPMATALMKGDPETLRQYILKSMMPFTKSAVCTWFDCTPARAIHRDGLNGEWIWADIFMPPAGGHVLKAPGTQLNWLQTNDMLRYGLAFIRSTSIDPKCLVLTTTPNDRFDLRPEVRALADLLGAQVIIPSIPDVVMVDEDHLNLPTAERWSGEFLAQFAPLVARCVR